MSFWDNVKKFAQPYADDDYDDYDEDEEFLDEYEEPAAPARRAPSRRRAPEPAPVMDEMEEEDDDFGFGLAPATKSAPVATSTGFKGQVVSMATGSKQEVVLFRPNTFNDTTKAAEDLRDRKAVIVNLENVDPALSRRVVDFLSGCAYALDGQINKIAQSTYLFCPLNMDVVGDLESAQAESELYI